MSSSSQIIQLQGQSANLNGRSLENSVKSILESSGYRNPTKPKIKKNMIQYGNILPNGFNKLYARNYEFTLGVYNSPTRCDFFIVNREKFSNGLVIECKSQVVHGSVDEKFPFLLLNSEIKCVPTIIIADGNGFRAGAIDYLKAGAAICKYVSAVYNLQEFEDAVSNGLL